MLPSEHHTAGDLERWRSVERAGLAHSRMQSHRRAVDRAQAAVEAFARHPCFVGVSWGKDSVALAHLCRDIDAPLIWVRVDPIANPDCSRVRDAYLSSHEQSYHEVTVICTAQDDDSKARGFAEAARIGGQRYLSGVRGAESPARRRRMRRYGTETERTCAPIGRWSDLDVWAYLVTHDLPVHPAYAYTMGGLLDPSRLRVGEIGGASGDGMGRRQWEEQYYPEVLARLPY